MAELNLNTQGNDWYDVSLVNGFNYGVSIKPSSGNAITVTSATGNAKNPGVYPLDATFAQDHPTRRQVLVVRARITHRRVM